MVRTTGFGNAIRLITGAAIMMGLTAPARAVYMDEDQNWSLRLRAYSQFAIRLQQSRTDTALSPVTGQREETQTVPNVEPGQLVQNRFFASPEVDVKLTPYLGWMRNGWLRWLKPDDMRMRVTAWGFYDGVYDYGADQFDDTQRLINRKFDPNVARDQSRPDGIREGGWVIEATRIRLNRQENGNVVASNFEEIFPGYKLKNPRTTYGYQRRLNEFYINYSKGPLFLRVGKQSLSWGESDTIALLDQTNPFSVLMGAPGFFQDIDEARLPLWTLRASYDLFSSLGPFSSGFIEGYWVPGDLDTNTGILPIFTASPYSAPGADPGRGNPIFPSTNQFVLVDQIPGKNFKNSRYGFRFQTVLNRFLTLQAWFYRTFPQQPVPQKIGFDPGTGNRDIRVEDTNGDSTSLFIVALQHKLTSVYGLSGTFFAEPLDGIVRINAQLFENEPGFIPEENLRIGTPSESVQGQGALPRADVFRYEVGFDRFFFFRPLNPTNSFILVASVSGFWNLDHTGTRQVTDPATGVVTTIGKDFRFAGLTKRGIQCDAFPSTNDADVCRANGGNPLQLGNQPDHYIQQKSTEAQAQITLQSDWMHGKLQPRFTAIAFTRGTWAVHPAVTWRFSDSLLFSADFQWIGGDYQSLGIFSDRAQVSGRVTYQLN